MNKERIDLICLTSHLESVSDLILDLQKFSKIGIKFEWEASFANLYRFIKRNLEFVYKHSYHFNRQNYHEGICKFDINYFFER